MAVTKTRILKSKAPPHQLNQTSLPMSNNSNASINTKNDLINVQNKTSKTIISFHDINDHITSVTIASIPRKKNTNQTKLHAKNYVNGILLLLEVDTDIQDSHNIHFLKNHPSWISTDNKFTLNATELADGFIMIVDESKKDCFKDWIMSQVYTKNNLDVICTHRISGVLPPPIILDFEFLHFLKANIPSWYQTLKVTENSNPVLIKNQNTNYHGDFIMDVSYNAIDDECKTRLDIYQKCYAKLLKYIYEGENASPLIVCSTQTKENICDWLFPTLVTALDDLASNIKDDDYDFSDKESGFRIISTSGYKNSCLLFSINNSLKLYKGDEELVLKSLRNHVLTLSLNCKFNFEIDGKMIDLADHFTNIFANDRMLEDKEVCILAYLFDSRIIVIAQSIIVFNQHATNTIYTKLENNHFTCLIPDQDDLIINQECQYQGENLYGVTVVPKGNEGIVKVNSEVNDSLTTSTEDANGPSQQIKKEEKKEKKEKKEERKEKKEKKEEKKEEKKREEKKVFTHEQNKSFESDSKCQTYDERSQFCSNCKKIKNQMDMLDELNKKFNTLEGQIAALKNKVASQDVEIDKLKKENIQLRDEVSNFQRINVQLEEKVEVLTLENERLSEENDKLTNEIAESIHLKEENKLKDQTINELTERNKELTRNCESLKNQLADKQEHNPPNVENNLNEETDIDTIVHNLNQEEASSSMLNDVSMVRDNDSQTTSNDHNFIHRDDSCGKGVHLNDYNDMRQDMHQAIREYVIGIDTLTYSSRLLNTKMVIEKTVTELLHSIEHDVNLILFKYRNEHSFPVNSYDHLQV